jgi:hypothetical protein
MDELRSALWAFLDAGDIEHAGWRPLIGRLNQAIEAVADADALEALAKEFRAEAIARGQGKFAWSPLYPWGVVGYLDAKRDRLRYEAHAHAHEGPCNCALVTRIGLIQQLDVSNLRPSGEGRDESESWKDFECPSCGARWRQHDTSTEQYSSWRWELTRAGPRW